MEVLRHGNTYKEVECKECGALLSYCETDIRTDCYSDEYLHGEWYESYRKYIKCLECNKDITVSWVKYGEEQII